MAKQITQETFNNVVLENIQEFEMPPDEAVEDAIKQFEAQGVNLMMIMKDSKMFTKDGMNEEASVENELTTYLNKLTEITKSKIEETKLFQECKNIQQICSQGIGERCLATKVGANDILFECIVKISNCDISDVKNVSLKMNLDECQLSSLNSLLQTYCCYIESQPDLMNDKIMNSFLAILKCDIGLFDDVKVDAQVICTAESLLEICMRFCYMHENNRQSLIQAGLALTVVEMLGIIEKKNEDDLIGLVVRGCGLLKALVADDDIRVAFGRAHEHCQIIVNKCDALPVLFSVLKKFKKRLDATSSILSAIGQLVVRDEFCVKVSEMDGISVVMEIVRQTLQDGKKSPVLKSSLQLLKNLSGSDKVKVEIMSQDQGPWLLCEAMERQMSDAGICEAACLLVASLVLRYPEHARVFVEENSIHHLLSRVMVIHEKLSHVQKSCSMVIRNIVSRNPELISPFLDVGIEELLRKALARHHDSCKDEINYALRDLNCEVQLRELWKGTGKTLEQ